MAGLVEQEAKDAKKLLVSSTVGGLRAGEFDELLPLLLLVDELEGDGKGDDGNENDYGG